MSSLEQLARWSAEQQKRTNTTELEVVKALLKKKKEARTTPSPSVLESHSGSSGAQPEQPEIGGLKKFQSGQEPEVPVRLSREALSLKTTLEQVQRERKYLRVGEVYYFVDSILLSGEIKLKILTGSGASKPDWSTYQLMSLEKGSLADGRYEIYDRLP